MQTHKYGDRRWHCRYCGHTFRPRKKHHQKDKRWLKSYLLDGSSLRRLGERWQVSHMTAWRRIQKTFVSNIAVEKLIVLMRPPYSRIILLDAKHFQIQKEPYTIYVAFDSIRKKPICWILLPRYELRKGYDRIFTFFHKENCLIEAIISDGHKGLAASVGDYYPLTIHQRCAFHVLQEVYRRLGGRWFLATDSGKKIWPIMRKIALGFNNEIMARKYLQRKKRKYPEYHQAFLVLQRSLSGIYQFTKKPELPIPRTSNLIENFMGHLEHRLKTFRGVKTPNSLIKIITSLIVLKYKRPTKK